MEVIFKGYTEKCCYECDEDCDAEYICPPYCDDDGCTFN